MEISRAKMFRTLFKKDLLLGKNESLLILGFIVLGNIFLYYKSQTTIPAEVWPVEAAFGLSSVLLSFIPLSIFFRSFASISSEWKENTVYMMMSLPVSGTMILLSKVLSLITRLLILLIVALPFTAIFFMKMPLTQMFVNIDIDMNLVKIISMYVGILILMYILYLVIAIFSAQIGTLVKKFSGLFTFIIFIVMNMVVSKLIEISYRGIGFRSVNLDYGHFQVDMIPFTDFLIASSIIMVITAAVFFVTAKIYDKKVEL